MEVNEPYIAISHLSTLSNNTENWRAERPVINKGKCNKCSLCWIYCPDTAIELDGDGFYQIRYAYCKGCGICAQVCPRKAINMERESQQRLITEEPAGKE
jgi:2-oxoacid:acceptor oxidoreductase delta subunit (pyruvate/2-ketoisovalerate family)